MDQSEPERLGRAKGNSRAVNSVLGKELNVRQEICSSLTLREPQPLGALMAVRS